MSSYDVATLLLCIVAVFSYINEKYVKLPTAIGLMSISLCLSLGLIALNFFGLPFDDKVAAFIGQIDFYEALMGCMLSFLLFAGALHVDLNDLKEQGWPVLTFATFGLLCSIGLIGLTSWLLFSAAGIEISFWYCLLFGSLISPTDPIAVLALMKDSDAPEALRVKIAGESLFNDGVGVVAFLVLLGIATGTKEASLSNIGGLFFQEAGGGVIFGMILGYLCYWFLKSIDNYVVEVLISLAIVMGGYQLAQMFHISGPIAMVVAGLMVGNQGRTLAMSDVTRDHVDKFWLLIDEILNAILFVLIGLELLLISFSPKQFLLGLVIIPLILSIRLFSLSIPVAIMRRFRNFTPNIVKIMTWGGLRGGISVALVLSLPAGPEREILLVVTYMVVVFSIIVQGLTFPKFLKIFPPR